ncbi:transcriptional regulator [Pseudalgibacter alginicilyticus]|uniref:Transcriptional regulator n=1 Tax=Pseudalgibacter alginicilyticus TaxID=1736674 RepID=A0A0P0D0N7_9FLAO|nr:YqgE/AlgH family protein [Pseudalgibacter alginicilyticus]ALJ06511.1 transcriptional regulator [Pseudalgibacter alginicilyticus]
MITIKPKKGDLLIAEPAIIGDMSFNRSIVLLADHTKEGSIGFILNKPLNYNINDLVPEIESSTFRVYNGGPVEQDNLYFIHKVPQLIPDSIEISLGIYWGGDFGKVAELIAKEEIKETDIRFFLGYSGWGNNQLETELKSNSWVVTDNIYEKDIIEKSYESFWKEKMLEFGGEYSIWSNAPENPNYN